MEFNLSILNRDLFFARAVLPMEKHEIPELGGSVNIRGLTGSEWDSITSKRDKSGEIEQRALAARFVAVGVVDDERKPVFAPGDVEGLNSLLPYGVLLRIANIVKKLSGLKDDEGKGDEKN